MTGLSFVSEKQIGDVIYQAWRNSASPTEVIVLKDGVSVNYSGSFAEFWRGLK